MGVKIRAEKQCHSGMDFVRTRGIRMCVVEIGGGLLGYVGMMR